MTTALPRTIPVPHLEEAPVALECRTQDDQAQLTTNPPEPSSDSNGSSSLSGPDILAKLDVPGNWSGKGQHVEFARNEVIPLEQGEFLGRGAFADVHEVRCKGFVIARKQIHCSRHLNIDDVKRELDILKKISHKHAVTLLGSYTKTKILGLLLYPVAVCDLGVFLEELDEYQRTDPPYLGEGLEKLVDRLGFPGDIHRSKERLNRVYGCLARAIQYLHDHDIRHKDIKPRNILLDKNDGLYITDFGLSRDTADASSSVTNGIERGTYKYCAPEVARYEPRGRAADVYSLGCMFLEINTVQRRLSLTAFDDFRTENEDRSFQNNPQKLLEWMSKLRQINVDIPDCGVFDMVDIIEKMVSPNPNNRPAIGAVCSSLYVLGDLVYFGKCCRTPRYQALVNENAKLNQECVALLRQHEVEHPAQIRRLKMDLDSIEKQNHKEMSMMAQTYRVAKKKHENEIVAMAKEQQDTESRHQKELGDLNNIFRAELSGMKCHLDQEMAAMAEKRRETEGKHQAQLGSLRETHRRQYHDQYVNLEDEKTELSDAHRIEFSRYKSEMEAMLDTKQYQINTIEARIQKLEEDKLELKRSFEDERFQLLNLQRKYDELSAVRKAEKHHFENSMGAEILKLEQDKLDLERHFDEEHTRHVMWKMKYHELSAMKRADEKQAFSVAAHPKVESETSISPKIDRDASKVQTENETQEATKEEKPSDGQAWSPAQEPSGQDTGEECRRSKEAPKTEKPTVRRASSMVRLRRKQDMGGEVASVEQASSVARRHSQLDMGNQHRRSKEAPKIVKPTVGQPPPLARRRSKRDMEEERRRSKRDAIEEEIPTVRLTWASSRRLDLNEPVAKGVTKKTELRNGSQSPAINRSTVGQPRDRQSAPPTFFGRMKGLLPSKSG